MEENTNFNLAAGYCYDVIRRLLPLKAGNVVSVNIPQLSKGKPKGAKIVAQSTQGFREHYIRKKTEQEQIVYMLNGGEHKQEPQDTDTMALSDGFITVSALHYDMTDYQGNEALKKTLQS
jgi:5'-nucleotidase